MFENLLLLNLLVTVPQNTFLPLIYIGLTEEAPVVANNGYISRNINADIRSFSSNIYKFTPSLLHSGQSLLNYLHVICVFQTWLNNSSINYNLFSETCWVYAAVVVCKAKSHRGADSPDLSDNFWGDVLNADLTELWVRCWG